MDRSIRNVNYFADLKIVSAFYRKFTGESAHHRIECAPGMFSLEMIPCGEVDLILDETRIPLRGPCLFWIGDGSGHFQFEPIPGKDYEHCWIDFTGERGRRIYDSLRSACPKSFISLRSAKKFMPVFRHFIRKFKVARRPDSTAEDVFLIEKLMFELIREIPVPAPVNDPYGIRSLAETFRNAPFGSYDVRQMARDAGLSYIRFRNLFREIHGETVHQFILEHRMLTAAELLKSGQFRIGELADYCGYPDPASFTRAFRRYYRTAPKRWLTEYSGGKKSGRE